MNFLVRLMTVAALFPGVMVTWPAYAGCEVADVDVRISQSVWHNRCSKKNCAELKGEAMVTSRCEELIGIQVRLTALDANGAALVQLERWPWDISRIAGGTHTFSINHWIEYDPRIRDFRIEAIGVKSADQ